jgi:excisionase family DNA binding protein
MENRELRTVQSVAQELGVTYRTIINLIHKGEFPNAFKIGDGRTMPWLIPAKDVEDYKLRQK